ncbi:hypothetical protein [Rhodopseudomonas palustris]|uniref:hypothetical protein n=1 Tax=Rhodopseudomonas palustris TaxID=1076 RepID=UPI000CEC56EE|nr:hypothetical protein [Rhodopseudomonas palustris]PPQ45561.1 hypothetical protein CKO39_02405 [Rhodopseudomonas palustris]
MNLIRRTFDLDLATDERLRALAAERGQDEAAVLAKALALLASVGEVEIPDVAEDRRRLDRFRETGQAVPITEVRAWVESWGTDSELPQPSARLVG